ncbi:uncharacterized protein NECHADRAFT_88870 [Fusarium vanettenii 77-13-4]|uniref:Uncharacterized protein n=1 Tax=Fusarium vanettenii (strain ATCC MYA-4622 / CBS 123669 / FGSC 9596 / NRRL 45880 / 77-13-4) TaxID=660122 RepID=C7ZN54_FUSV7|nr:uncharacterized protein NECHADRAFT_88870 [Fusarium vanettenii 77-13-4]EEU34575.1 predicted protein [Fusarium vanettenii 77-13-4]
MSDSSTFIVVYFSAEWLQKLSDRYRKTTEQAQLPGNQLTTLQTAAWELTNQYLRNWISAPNEASGHLAHVLQAHAEPEQQAILRGLIFQKPTLAQTYHQAQTLLPRFDRAVARRGRIEKKKTKDIF